MTESLASFSVLRAVPSMSPAELRHALKVVAVALQGKAGNMAATDALSDVAGHLRGNSEPQTLAQIALHVALKHGLTVEELRAPSAKDETTRRDYAWPRQEAFWMARQLRYPKGDYRYSSVQIGRYFGGRDHTSVLWGVRQHEARLRQEVAA